MAPTDDLSDIDLSDIDLSDIDLSDIDLTDLDRFADGFPHPVFTRLRGEAPVWFHPATAHTPGGEGFWVVSRHADCVTAGAAKDVFSSETGPGRDGAGGTLIEDLPGGFAAGVLLNMTDDPRHQAVRRLLTPSLSPRALATLEADLQRRALAIVGRVEERTRAREAVDLVVDLAAELPLQAIAEIMGVPQEERRMLFDWSNRMIGLDDPITPPANARRSTAVLICARESTAKVPAPETTHTFPSSSPVPMGGRRCRPGVCTSTATCTATRRGSRRRPRPDFGMSLRLSRSRGCSRSWVSLSRPRSRSLLHRRRSRGRGWRGRRGRRTGRTRSTC